MEQNNGELTETINILKQVNSLEKEVNKLRTLLDEKEKELNEQKTLLCMRLQKYYYIRDILNDY